MALYLPERYAGLQEPAGGVRTFGGRELAASDRVLRQVLHGGLAVLEGPWEQILKLHDHLQRRCPDPAMLGRLMVRATGDLTPDLEPPQQVLHLAMIVGETAANGAYLVAVADLRRAMEQILPARCARHGLRVGLLRAAGRTDLSRRPGGSRGSSG